MSDEPTAKFHLIRLEKVAEGLGVPFGWLHKKAKEGKITCLKCDRVILADPRVVANEINSFVSSGSVQDRREAEKQRVEAERQKRVELVGQINDLKSQVKKAINELAKADVDYDNLKEQCDRKTRKMLEATKHIVITIGIDRLTLLLANGILEFHDADNRHIEVVLHGGKREDLRIFSQAEISNLEQRAVLAEDRIMQIRGEKP